MSRKKEMSLPTLEQLETELERVRYQQSYRAALRGTIGTILVIAAAAVLMATLFLPVFRIYGSSMEPTLKGGEVLLAAKQRNYERGDIIAFYYNNKILVKRVVGLPGETVNIDKEGRVYIDNALLEEPYLEEGTQELGDCDIELPMEVADGRFFVMGDHRSVSADSRSTKIGCIQEDQIAGKLIYRVWPLEGLGRVE